MGTAVLELGSDMGIGVGGVLRLNDDGDVAAGGSRVNRCVRGIFERLGGNESGAVRVGVLRSHSVCIED